MKRDWVQKQKQCSKLLRFSVIFFQNTLFPKEFLECIGHISSELLNSGLELVSGANVLFLEIAFTTSLEFLKLNTGKIFRPSKILPILFLSEF